MGRDDGLDKVLGPLEAEVVRAVWAEGRMVTVRQVLERVNGRRERPLAYTTVMTILTRLNDKGVLRRHQHGRAYQYEATVRDAAGLAVRTVVRDFGPAAIAQFVDEVRADPKLLRRLERLLEEGQ